MSAPVRLDDESTVRENLLALRARLDRLHNDRTDRARRYLADPNFGSAFVERDRAWMPSVLGGDELLRGVVPTGVKEGV